MIKKSLRKLQVSRIA